LVCSLWKKTVSRLSKRFSARHSPRNPRNAKTHSLLAKSLLGKGDREAARVELDQALGLVPNQREFIQLKNDIER
jgi:uncharacterized protein HemY